jgi:hypothetical protein
MFPKELQQFQGYVGARRQRRIGYGTKALSSQFSAPFEMHSFIAVSIAADLLV